LYAASGGLMAMPFDTKNLKPRGVPTLVVSQPSLTVDGGADVAIAGNGSVAYANASANALRTLQWVDRQGHELEGPVGVRSYGYPRISPDGKRAAISLSGVSGENGGIWMLEADQSFTRFTVGSFNDSYPVWIPPDGSRLAFSSERVGQRNLFWQAA